MAGPVERAAGGTSLIDVLDRVLDKGIVIDAWVRVSLVGIDLITVEARVVVASIDTYLKYSEAVGQVTPVSRPQPEITSAHQNVIAENAALRAELAATQSGDEGGSSGAAEAHQRLIGGAACRGDGRASRSIRDGGEARAGRVPAHQHRSSGLCPPRRRLARGPRGRRAGRRGGLRARHGSLLLVAEHGVSSAAIVDFSLTREDEGHPLVRVLERSDPAFFSTPSPLFRTPLDGRPFHAIPLRGDDDPVAHGLLLASAAGPAVAPEVVWLARMLGRQVSRLLSRERLAETRFGQERMLLYSIINAVTDPDSADRHRRQADHREHARGKAVRGARGLERRAGAARSR